MPVGCAARRPEVAPTKLVRSAESEPALLATVDTLVEAAFAAGEGSAPLPNEGMLF